MPKSLAAGLVLALLAGLALRLAAARGDLWLDEIWSLDLVAPLRSAGAVFWGISHDNNHFLNSLWLYAAGAGRPAVVYRLPAVLFGTLSILVAARIGLRRDPATAVAAALLTAFSFPLVNYGSEARGYAGLILAILLAVDSFEQAIAPRLAGSPPASPPGNAYRWTLGLAIGFGALSHLTMLATVAVLGLTATIRLGQAGRRPAEMLDELVRLFAPSALMLLPAFAALTAGIVIENGFTLGGAEPFGFGQFAAGYGDLLRYSTGLPASVPIWSVFALTGAGLAFAWRGGLVERSRQVLLGAALVILPGIMLAARLPNMQFPRYFLLSGVVLLLCEADAIGRLWNGGAFRRWTGAVFLACIVAGQGFPLAGLLRDGRGSYGDALARMAAEGGTAYASNRSFATRTVVDHFGAKAGISLTAVANAAFCAQKPDWFVDGADAPAAPPQRAEFGPAACRTPYVLRAIYPASALSGLPWRLYRRAD